MRVLLIESGSDANRDAVLALKSANAITDHVGSARAALAMLHRTSFDAAILDLVLPDMKGCEMLRRMRAAFAETPVLVLTDRGRMQAGAEAVEAGASDFIVRPFDVSELATRLRALVRRQRSPAQSELQVGKLQLRPDSREAFIDHRPIPLTGKEYTCLELLVLHKGLTVTKEMFLNHLYAGKNEPEMKIIDVFVCKLRKKLALAGAGNLIGTVWGRGYIIREPAQTNPLPAAPSGLREAGHVLPAW